MNKITVLKTISDINGKNWVNPTDGKPIECAKSVEITDEDIEEEAVKQYHRHAPEGFLACWNYIKRRIQNQ